MKNEQHIVCDTNIWYDLNDEIVSMLPKHIKLYSTRLCVLELLHSEKLYYKFNDVKKACLAILKYANGFIDLHPLSWMSYDRDIQFYNFKNSNLFKQLHALSKLTKDEVTNSEEIKTDHNEWKECLETFFVKYFMDNLQEAKLYIEPIKNIVKSTLIQKKVKEEILISTRQQVLKEFNTYNQTRFKIDEINWEDYELYINARCTWINKLKMQKTMKVDRNDLVDLLNMVYVKRDWYYWTKDEKWIEIIKEAGMSHYLFDSVID